MYYINGVLQVRCYIQAVDTLAQWSMRGRNIDAYIDALAKNFDRDPTETRRHVLAAVADWHAYEDRAVARAVNRGC